MSHITLVVDNEGELTDGPENASRTASVSGIVKDWNSTVVRGDGTSRSLLGEDDQTIRKYLHRRSVTTRPSPRSDIERKPSKIVVTLHTARPGVVIGKRGAEVDKLRDELCRPHEQRKCRSTSRRSSGPELNRRAWWPRTWPIRLRQRVSFRRAMKRAVQSAIREPVPRGSRFSVQGDSAGPKSRARKDTTKDACRCTRCARTSTTPRSSMLKHHVRDDRREVLDFPREKLWTSVFGRTYSDGPSN